MKLLLSLLCATISLIVKNTGDTQRQEVVEADLQTVCQQLGVETDDPLTIRNAFGQEITYLSEDLRRKTASLCGRTAGE